MSTGCRKSTASLTRLITRSDKQEAEHIELILKHIVDARIPPKDKKAVVATLERTARRLRGEPLGGFFIMKREATRALRAWIDTQSKHPLASYRLLLTLEEVMDPGDLDIKATQARLGKLARVSRPTVCRVFKEWLHIGVLIEQTNGGWRYAVNPTFHHMLAAEHAEEEISRNPVQFPLPMTAE